MRFAFLAVVTALLVSSCTLEQNFAFKEDFSGRYEVRMDFSAMKALMDMSGEEATSDSPDLDGILNEVNVDSLVEAMNMQQGISNSVVSESDGKIVIGYDFSDLDALNASLAGSDVGELMGNPISSGEGGGPSIKRKGKKVSLTMSDLEDLKNSEEMESMEGMGGMITYKMQMSFEQEIKKVNNKSATLSYDNKTVTVEANMDELLSGDVTPGMTVKLK